MAEPLTVVKVGGSVLRGTDCYSRVADRLTSLLAAGRVWIVVSASQGTTRRLRAAASGDAQASADLGRALAAVPAGGTRARLEELLKQGFAAAARGRPAALVAWGEQCSAVLLADALRARGHDLPIVELSARARPAPFRHAVVPGYYLRDRHGRPRLLPEGGSDISAALVASWLEADVVRLWKDGGGIRAGEAYLASIDATALRERLRGTIHPLHPAAVAIAARAGVPLVLEDPWGEHPATQVLCDHPARALPAGGL